MDEKPQTLENWTPGVSEVESVAGVTFDGWQEMKDNLLPDEPHVISVRSLVVIDAIGRAVATHRQAEMLVGRDKEKLLAAQSELEKLGKQVDVIIALGSDENGILLTILDVRSQKPVPVIEIKGKSYALRTMPYHDKWRVELEPSSDAIVIKIDPRDTHDPSIQEQVRCAYLGSMHGANKS